MYTIMCNHVYIHTIFAKSFLQAEALVLAIAGGTELVTKILQVFFQKETTPSSKVIIIIMGICLLILSLLPCHSCCQPL